jgi:uncharacterized cupredoxin-like copper-binding protein
MMTVRSSFAALAVAVISMGFVAPAAASSAWREVGERGRPQDARRTVDIVMRDNAFEPQQIQVRAGETVRFRIRNQGDLLHEFNIGTPAMHVEHWREMIAMMEAGHMTATSMMPAHGATHGSHGSHGGSGHRQAAMAHDDPNSLLLEPGKSGELIWKFTHAMTLEFACNVPGHYEVGMVGQVRFGR